MAKFEILIVEDDPYISDSLKKIFVREGYSVKVSNDGEEGFILASSRDFDLIILDVMLPGMNGFEFCSKLRDQEVKVPILMLTVKDAVEDKVEGLERGADDYITKPFSTEELIARVRALIRRSKEYKGTVKVGDLEVDFLSRKVFREGKLIELSSKEFDILEVLFKNRGRIVGEKVLLKEVWNSENIKSSVLRVYMHHLRQKLDKSFSKKIIKTVRGVGYMLDVS